MPKFVSPAQAVESIPEGATIGINAFINALNPRALLVALAQRYEKTGKPGNLTFFGSSSFGGWDENAPSEAIIRAGAVKSLVLSHYSSMPVASRAILENRMEGYNLPFGVMCQLIREAVTGKPFFITETGLNVFVDPVYGGSKLNEISREDWVSDVVIDGKRYLKYKTPKFDCVFIKGSSADQYGNITFERETLVLDARNLAMAAHNAGGKVIVQVGRMRETHDRPWNVIIPGSLVDAVCVCPEDAEQIMDTVEFDPVFAGDVFVPPEQVAEWVRDRKPETDPARLQIVERAAEELRAGQMVNLGIGIPEGISAQVVKKNLLSELTLTVESGEFGGMPSSGHAFGSAVGAHCIIETGEMFEFYNGGGLDICFIGAMEIDRFGNVNAHFSPGKLAGIGGFIDITQGTKKIVFCSTFTSGGLQIERDESGIHILREGKYRKLVEKVNALSFSAENALAQGQEVLYVTERCVFRLGNEGLELIEVYPGVEPERDILAQLPFPVKICLQEESHVS